MTSSLFVPERLLVLRISFDLGLKINVKRYVLTGFWALLPF